MLPTRSTLEDLDTILADVERLVTIESPSSDLDAVARSAEAVAALLVERLGTGPETVVIDGVAHLRVRFGSGPRRTLLLAHHDTVWPLATIERLPFQIRDGRMSGPGCFDMKTGLVMAVHALAHVAQRDPALLDGVTLLVTGDEEIGSPTSRALIEAEAIGCQAAFVLEPAADGGAFKTGRKGVSNYLIRITGRAAHAGLEPEKGVNAGVELAYQMIKVGEIADASVGTTVTPTLASAGDTRNTVPAHASVFVDARTRTAAEQRRVDDAVRALTPVIGEVALDVEGGPNRPPMDPASAAPLFTRAQRLAAELELPPLRQASVGGGSDGNFTAGVGVPTLDGMGAVGGGAHAESEHVLVAEIPGRVELLAALISELGGARA